MLIKLLPRCLAASLISLLTGCASNLTHNDPNAIVREVNGKYQYEIELSRIVRRTPNIHNGDLFSHDYTAQNLWIYTNSLIGTVSAENAALTFHRLNITPIWSLHGQVGELIFIADQTVALNFTTGPVKNYSGTYKIYRSPAPAASGGALLEIAGTQAEFDQAHQAYLEAKQSGDPERIRETLAAEGAAVAKMGPGAPQAALPADPAAPFHYPDNTRITPEAAAKSVPPKP